MTALGRHTENENQVFNKKMVILIVSATDDTKCIGREDQFRAGFAV